MAIMSSWTRRRILLVNQLCKNKRRMALKSNLFSFISMTLIRIRIYGHGVASLCTEIMSLWARSLLRGKSFLIKENNNNSTFSWCFSYGFSADRLICVGFIERPKSSSNKIVTSDYILSRDARYEIDIAGTRFRLTPYLHAPPVFNSVKQKYRPTVISYKSDVLT